MAVLAILCAVPRLVNLGTFSMWLDEILQTRQASDTLKETWAALTSDVVHPPLDGVLTWLWLQVGLGETARRIVPVCLGVFTVVILVRWASERFGSRIGWICGVLAALAPFHVHLSQELRPYSLALFFMMVALWSFDRILSTGAVGAWILLASALLGCLYTLYFSILVVVPITVLGLEAWAGRGPALRSAAGRVLIRLPLLAAVLVAAYGPWLAVVRSIPSREVELGAQPWSLQRAVQRWEHLSIGGLEGDSATLGVALPIVLCGVGALAGARRFGGIAVLSGALVGTVGVEALLWTFDHWSNDRYSFVAWPFVCLLLALGVARLGTTPWLGRLAVPVMIVSLVLLLALEVRGLRRDYTRGRPHWRWVAESVAALVSRTGVVFSANSWTHICLTFYLDEIGEESLATAVRLGDAHEIVEASLQQDCVLLVAGGYPSPAPLVRALSSPIRLLRDPGGLGSGVYRLSPYQSSSRCVWVPPHSLRFRPDRRLFSAAREATSRLVLEFDRSSSEGNLLQGWSDYERNPRGDTFVWASANTAVLALGGLEPARRLLTIDLWPLEVPGRQQRIAILLNHQLLDELLLVDGRQSLALDVADAYWSRNENLLEFRFSYTISPRFLDNSSQDGRELAVAFDRLSVERLSEEN